MRLSAVGRHDEAISAIRRAEVLDPVSLIINSNHGWRWPGRGWAIKTARWNGWNADMPISL
jgi:hypothetical protein